MENEFGRIEMKNFLTIAALLLVGTLMNSEAFAARCEMELVNGRGRVLDVFTGYGYDRQDACWEARQDCRRAKNSGYYSARRLSCVKVQNRQVTKYCSAELTGPRGRRVMQRFTALATGPRGSGVKARACQKALNQCEREKMRSGRYRAVCISEQGRGGRYPIPTPHQPRRPRRH